MSTAVAMQRERIRMHLINGAATVNPTEEPKKALYITYIGSPNALQKPCIEQARATKTDNSRIVN